MTATAHQHEHRVTAGIDQRLAAAFQLGSYWKIDSPAGDKRRNPDRDHGHRGKKPAKVPPLRCMRDHRRPHGQRGADKSWLAMPSSAWQ